MAVGGPDYWGNPASITHAKCVSDLYNAFMRRSADLDGFNYWVSALANRNPRHTEMRKSLIDTPEYAVQVQAIVGQGEGAGAVADKARGAHRAVSPAPSFGK